MGSKKIARKYQQSLIDAYYDFKMHEILDPLYEAFQQWKQGSLQHDDLTELIHKVHRENQKIFSFFTQDWNTLIFYIKLDTDWFPVWFRNNPPPPGMEFKTIIL